jgi:hypothetical protein
VDQCAPRSALKPGGDVLGLDESGLDCISRGAEPSRHEETLEEQNKRVVVSFEALSRSLSRRFAERRGERRVSEITGRRWLVVNLDL